MRPFYFGYAEGLRSVRFHIALWLTPLGLGWAQTPPAALTLDDCIRRALAAQSAVSIARQQAQIADSGVTQARAGFLPQASAQNSYTYNSPLPRTSEFSFVALNGVREYSILGNIALDLDTSGRLRAQLARARADQAAAAANLGLAQRELRRAVTAAYYRVLLARHVAAAARDSLAESQSFEKRTRLLVQAGEAAQADAVKAGAEAAFLDQQLNIAQLEERIANHDLAAFWTVDVDAPVALADELNQAAPQPEAAPPGAPYIGRLEFRLLEAQRRGFLADARRVRADLYPQLSVVTQYGIDSTRFSFADRGYAAFVHLNVPVFDWFRTRAAARQFTLQASQVETARAINERIFSRDYRDAAARVELLYAQISLTETQVRLSQDNLRLARVRYEGGEGSALEVVSAQSQLATARTNHFTAKANYLNARADLQIAMGK